MEIVWFFKQIIFSHITEISITGRYFDECYREKFIREINLSAILWKHPTAEPHRKEFQISIFTMLSFTFFTRFYFCLIYIANFILINHFSSCWSILQSRIDCCNFQAGEYFIHIPGIFNWRFGNLSEKYLIFIFGIFHWRFQNMWKILFSDSWDIPLGISEYSYNNARKYFNNIKQELVYIFHNIAKVFYKIIPKIFQKCPWNIPEG